MRLVEGTRSHNNLQESTIYGNQKELDQRGGLLRFPAAFLGIMRGRREVQLRRRCGAVLAFLQSQQSPSAMRFSVSQKEDTPA